ncbi:MAG: hypothetical protein M0C28_11855, partial [Candidatus Moduliflexus flocculans]|nr:hypothetical protein [Candidatus Moduliflexus flocculans]
MTSRPDRLGHRGLRLRRAPRLPFRHPRSLHDQPLAGAAHRQDLQPLHAGRIRSERAGRGADLVSLSAPGGAERLRPGDRRKPVPGRRAEGRNAAHRPRGPTPAAADPARKRSR